MRKSFKFISDVDFLFWLGSNMMGRNSVIDKGFLLFKRNSFDDCIVLDKSSVGNNYFKSRLMFVYFEEDRILGNNLGVKRIYMEIRSFRNECLRLFLSNEEISGEVFGNGFVIVRIKLVRFYVVKMLYFVFLFLKF